MLMHPLLALGVVVVVASLSYGFGYAGGWFARDRAALRRMRDLAMRDQMVQRDTRPDELVR